MFSRHVKGQQIFNSGQKLVSGRATFKFEPTKEGYAQLGKDTIKTSKGSPLYKDQGILSRRNERLFWGFLIAC